MNEFNIKTENLIYISIENRLLDAIKEKMVENC